MEEISFQDHYYSDIDEPGRLPGWRNSVSGTCTIPTNSGSVLYGTRSDYEEPDLIKNHSPRSTLGHMPPIYNEPPPLPSQEGLQPSKHNYNTIRRPSKLPTCSEENEYSQLVFD